MIKGYELRAVLDKSRQGEKMKRVLFLGDSMTDRNHIGCTQNYWGYLGDRYGFEPWVYGVNGHQMSNLVGQVERFEAEHPEGVDIIFIFAGTNDFNSSVPLGVWYTEHEEMVNKDGNQVCLKKRTFVWDEGTFRGRINRVMSHLKSHFPQAWIIVLTPIHRGYATFGPTNVQPDEMYANQAGHYLDDYVSVLKEAGNVWSVRVVDLHAISGIFPLSPAHDNYISNPRQDRLHPSTAGQARIAEVIAQEVGGLLENE